MIIGANGIELLYVIYKNDAPNLTTQPTWEVKANLGAPYDGTAYLQEKLTVHTIFLRNIADGVQYVFGLSDVLLLHQCIFVSIA